MAHVVRLVVVTAKENGPGWLSSRTATDDDSLLSKSSDDELVVDVDAA